MRRAFIRLFLVVFFVSSGFFNVASADPAASVSSGVSTIEKIEIKQVSLKPLQLEIATTSTSDADLLYQIWGQDADGWTLVSAYSSNPVVTWNPSVKKDGIYQVQVRIKDSATGEFLDQMTEIKIVKDPSVLRVEKMITDAAIDGQGIVGDSIKIEAFASGAKDILYRFTVSQGKKWVAWSKYSTENTFVWKPNEAGNFLVRVEVKDKKGTQNDSMEKAFEIKEEGYTYPEFKNLSISQIKNSSNIRIQAEDVFRPGYIQNYKFTIGEQYRNPDFYDGYKNGFKTTWSADRSGVYEISAYVKDSKSTDYDDAYQLFKRITKPEVSTVKIGEVELSHPKKVQNINTTINFTTHATGGNSLLYAFYRYEAKGYVVLQDYSTKNTLSWTPLYTGEYIILARVKDVKSGSYEDEEKITYSIVDPTKPKISIKSIEIPNDIKVGKSQKVEVNAIGNENLLYQFEYKYDNYGWIVLRSYSPDNIYYWLPKHARNYKILVKVKDTRSGSFLSAYTKEISVTK